VIVVCGAAATGKTSLASALAASSGWAHISSDAVRKELLGLSPSDRAPGSAYSEPASLRTYEELGRRAALASDGALVDGTFRKRAHRAAFARGLGDREPPPLFAECRAPAAVVAERARAREADPGRVSDATAEIAAAQLSEFEPLGEVGPAAHVLLRTDRAVEEIADELVAVLDSRIAGRAGRL
jgi:predicted kinase